MNRLSGQRPASHSVGALPSTDTGENQKDVWAPGQWTVGRSKLFQINRVICQKPFQALATSDALALSVPRTGLVEKIYCRASDI